MKFTIIKLGGSYLTDKAGEETMRADHVERAALWVRGIWERGDAVVVVHGAGSFGHPQARAHGLGSKGYTGHSVAQAVCDVRKSVLSLHAAITAALVRAGLPATSLSLFAAGNVHTAAASALDLARQRGVPVLHGDVVLDPTCGGARVIGGDPILVALAMGLPSALLPDSRVIFATDVPGVYSAPPSHSEAQLLSEVSPSLLESAAVGDVARDVTGGMKAKLAAAFDIARLGLDVRILCLETPESEFSGTRICL